MSAWPEKRGEIKKMMEMAAKDIERLGGTVELVDIGKQKVRMVIGFSLPSLFNHNFWNLIVFFNSTIFALFDRCYYCVHAASLWRRDPPATYHLGSFGVRPWQEDRVHLWPS